MSRFIQKALEKVPRLEKNQLAQLLKDVVDEHELLESSLNSLPYGLVILDTENRLLFHNKAAERLIPMNVPGSESTDRPFWQFLRDPDITAFLRKSLENHETSAVREFALESFAGAHIVQFNLMPLVSSNRISGTIILVQDVTERKSRESRLRRAESLASLTTLAAGVAHEIKNPLGSIGIHIQLIQRALKNVKTAVPASVGHDLAIINEEIDRLNAIVVDFLFAVRPMDTTLVLGSLNKVVAETTEFLGPELAQNQIVLEQHLDSRDENVLVDERFLKQAILNIVKNSMHAMEGGGKLRVETLAGKESVDLTIGDSGTGIPEELLEKIFEPYFTTKDSGSGLGLTLVYKIVKEHGADIQVTSKVDSGTSVKIAFPLPNRTTPLLDFKGDGP